VTNTTPSPSPRRGRRRLDPAARRSIPLTAMVDERTAVRAWAAADRHPAGMSGLLRDALTTALDVTEAGR
jgi:hypothetical protein